MIKREVIAKFSERLGLTALAEQLPRRRGLLVLNYHRVGDPDKTPYDPGVFSASTAEFDWQLAYIKRHFRVTTLEEAVWLASHPSRFRTTEVLITFDDGYLDNYTNAFPILRAHGVQGTFFLPTSYLDSTLVPWWDGIAYVIRHTSKARIILRYPTQAEFVLGDKIRTSLRDILRLYKSAAVVDTNRFCDELSEACEVPFPYSSADRLFMTWSEARDMSLAGMAIASHTHSHEVLSKLTPEEQLKELQLSRSLLEKNLGIHVQAVAFPVGARTAFNCETQVATDRAGYAAAFSFYGGFNSHCKIQTLDVRREDVEHGTHPALFRLRYALIARFGSKLL